ncbi:30S ribosome-binding factor RbfA [Treponema sp.]|uniref:30S ribosome-binding factor RbfA n=1 Tax=Treponema sp. TaxID=166 RepID=UPI003EFDAF92
MGQYRMDRLGNQLREEIASLIMRHEVKDPRVNEFLTINRVEVVRDLSCAKVYVSSFLDDASVERGVKGLQSAAGFIQSSIAKKVSIYRFPKLTFVADFSMKEGYKMVQKLNALENESRKIENGQEEQDAGQEEQE